MTNGEMIKAMFPTITERFTDTDEYTNKPTKVEISVGMHILTTISADVWNSEYKEPTTKNDLGVDCISRKSVITIIQNHWWNCRDIDKLVNDLPSVTPQETCEDCISREKALELAENSYHLAETMEDLAWLYENNLKALPSVQPKQEPVIHAKWEKFCNKDGILRYLECSNCGQVSNQILLTYKYCPNCGARMDKE